MAKSKARWLALIDEYSAQPQNHTQNCGCETVCEHVAKLPREFATTTTKIPLKTLIDSEAKNAQEKNACVMTEELPIYEATAAQLNFWHAFGSNVFLQVLLRRYDLDFSSPNLHAYNKLKIGFDEKRHVATFAIDETHYYKIQFNEYNSAPVNSADAERVLEKAKYMVSSSRCLRDEN